MSYFLQVSPETLKATLGVGELKNASSTGGLGNEKPAWAVTYEYSVGNSLSLSNNNTEEGELKQAQTDDNNNSPLPSWLVTYLNTVGTESLD